MQSVWMYLDLHGIANTNACASCHIIMYLLIMIHAFLSQHAVTKETKK